MSRRTAGCLALVLVALGVTAAILAVAPGSSPSLATQAHSLSSELRCPSCAGESVADSTSPIAASMRQEVGEQLHAGRSEKQILAWFRQRYGDDVVMTPPLSGVGWLLWGGPLVVLTAGAVAAIRRKRWTASGDATHDAGCHPRPMPVRRLAVVFGAVALVAVGVPWAVAATTPATGGATAAAASSSGAAGSSSPQEPPASSWIAKARSLEEQGHLDDAVLAWRQAREVAPSSVPIATRLGFDLVRQGHPRQALALVRRPAARPGPDRPLALLVLGLAQRDLHRPDAAQTLRAFLRVTADHDAAEQVRRLLAESP